MFVILTHILINSGGFIHLHSENVTLYEGTATLRRSSREAATLVEEELSLSLPGRNGGSPSHGRDKWGEASHITPVPHAWGAWGHLKSWAVNMLVQRTNNAFGHLQQWSSYPNPTAVGNFPQSRERIGALLNQFYGRWNGGQSPQQKTLSSLVLHCEGQCGSKHCK